MNISDQINEPDEVVFTLKTEACGPIDPCDPETRDWKVSLKNTYKGAFLVGSETSCPPGEKKRRYRFMVPWDWAESVGKQLENWSVPIAPKFEMGYDGGFTELTCGGYCGKSSYRWWSSWHGSTLSDIPLAKDCGLNTVYAVLGNKKEEPWRLDDGGKIEVIYFDPQRSFTIEVPPAKKEEGK